MPGRTTEVEPSDTPKPAGDFRLVPTAGVVMACAATGVTVAPAAAVLAGLALLGVGALLVARRSVSRHATVALPVLAAGVTLAACAVNVAIADAGQLGGFATGNRLVVLEGNVVSTPRALSTAGPPRHLLRVKARSVHVIGTPTDSPANAHVLAVVPGNPHAPSSSPAAARGSTAETGVVPGARVRLTGRLRAGEPGERERAVLSGTKPVQLLAPPQVPGRIAAHLRAGLRRAAATLAPDPAGLLPSLVVGDTTGLPERLREDMRRTGLTHLSAVSGANISLVAGAALYGMRMLAARIRTQVIVTGAAAGGFVVLAGPEPSVLRAAAMGSVALLGLLAGRRGQAVAALSATVVALCVIDPYLSREIGFHLSVLATAGIVVLARPWAKHLGLLLPAPVAAAIAVPAAAQAVCGPVLLVLAPQVPVVAVAANVLAAPAVAPATVLGVMATVTSAVSDPAAGLLAGLAAWPLRWVAAVAHHGSALPAAVIAWPSGMAGALLLLAVTAVMVMAAGVSLRALAAARRRHLVDRVLRPEPVMTMRRLGRWAVPVALVLVAAVLGAQVAGRIAGGAGDDWLVAMCDVGQGDAVVISTGDGRAILTDTGPEPELVDACLDRLGVDDIDLLVLSHFHHDHVGGLSGVGPGRTIHRVIVSPLPEPAPGAASTAAELSRWPVAAEPGLAGLSGRAGPAQWHVLWPPDGRQRPGPDGQESVANNASVAVLVRVRQTSVLLLGDLEPAAQRELTGQLDRFGVDTIDIVKVAHHGSRFQHQPLYEQLDPRIALVSAGADNDYGHPAPGLVADLAADGAVIARTDTDGMTLVGAQGEQLWVHRSS